MELAKVNPVLDILNAKLREAAVEKDLRQTAAKISALKSGNIDKYEF